MITHRHAPARRHTRAPFTAPAAAAALALAGLATALLPHARAQAQQPGSFGSASASKSASTQPVTRSPSTLTPVNSPPAQRTPSTTTQQLYPPPAPASKPAASTQVTYSALPSSAAAGSSAATPLPIATDPAYRLAIGDELAVDVHGEADMSTAQRIDQQGNVRVPHLNEVNLANKTVREAESFLEQLYVEKRLLRKPLVNINVRQYATRQVTVIGAVNSPGVFPLPRETDSIEIVELITSIGGFRPTAKSDAVRVTRVDESGKETTTYVDVEAMIYNRRNALKSFKIQAGDRILVTERIW